VSTEKMGQCEGFRVSWLKSNERSAQWMHQSGAS